MVSGLLGLHKDNLQKAAKGETPPSMLMGVLETGEMNGHSHRGRYSNRISSEGSSSYRLSPEITALRLSLGVSWKLSAPGDSRQTGTEQTGFLQF